jgi:L-asparaginase
MEIQIFVTGGTFDKEYNEVTEKLFFNQTHLVEMLKIARCQLKVDIKKLMMMDSLDMTRKERELILKNCLKCKNNKIVITHGTGTMDKTSKLLAQKHKEYKDKTIVITGAMIPYRFGNSDGIFNLGSALSLVQTLSPGVYVAMNGEYFKAGTFKKNQLKGKFEKIK